MSDKAPHRLRSAFLELPRLVVGEPIREGRLDWRSWPTSLRAVSVVTGVAYVAAGVIVVLAPQIRQLFPMVFGYSGMLIPGVMVPALTILSLWCLILLQSAALAAHWSIKIVALMVSMVVISEFSVFGTGTQTENIWVGGAAFLGLIVYTGIRWRSRFRAIDTLVVATLVTVGTMVPMLLSGNEAIAYGRDFRPNLATGAMQILLIMSLPALLSAGAALAQITVSAGESVASVLRDFALRWVLVLTFVLALAVRILQTIPVLSDVKALSLEGSASLLVMAGIVVGIVWLIGRRRPPEVSGPGEASETWSRALYPLALVFLSASLTAIPLTGAAVVVSLFQTREGDIARIIIAILWSLFSNNLARIAAGIVALIVAIRSALRQRFVMATLLGAFAACMVFDRLLGSGLWSLTGGPTGDGLAVIATGEVILLLIWLGINRFRNTTALFATLALLFVCIFYSIRGLLDDPTTALVGVSGTLALFAGLLWRVLTDGYLTRGNSRALPSTTRVLLFWANSLFGVTALALVSLTRTNGQTETDLGQFEQLGDTYFGVPLVLTLMLSTFAVAFFPKKAKIIPMSEALAEEEEEHNPPPGDARLLPQSGFYTARGHPTDAPLTQPAFSSVGEPTPLAPTGYEPPQQGPTGYGQTPSPHWPPGHRPASDASPFPADRPEPQAPPGIPGIPIE